MTNVKGMIANAIRKEIKNYTVRPDYDYSKIYHLLSDLRELDPANKKLYNSDKIELTMSDDRVKTLEIMDVILKDIEHIY